MKLPEQITARELRAILGKDEADKILSLKLVSTMRIVDIKSEWVAGAITILDGGKPSREGAMGFGTVVKKYLLENDRPRKVFYEWLQRQASILAVESNGHVEALPDGSIKTRKKRAKK